MGVTISYRGSLDDLGRIQDFEDRVLDLSLELGGQATIWRTTADDDSRRAVRGVILNLFPGQEPTSLLISPEGWLINLCDIEEAEKGELDEPSWCFVKTQYGPIEGHVALVELLAVLKREFISNLEVSDEGGYWETRDLPGLTAKINFLKAAMKAFGEGLQRHGLSPEAAEDQEILLTRIERITQVVHRTLARPAEHPPVHWDDEEPGFGEDADDEAKWDASYKENRRRQEHVNRAIEEHLANGEDIDEAVEAAMLEETAAGLPDEESEDESDDWREDLEDVDDEADEPWKESLPEGICDDDDGEDGDFDGRPPHPLQQRAFDLIMRLHKLLGPGREERRQTDKTESGSHESVLLHGAVEIMGGLAQALGAVSEVEPILGLSVVQLKRAIRGAAFAQGALFPLRANGTLDKATFDELHETLDGLQTDIYGELARLRQRREGEF